MREKKKKELGFFGATVVAVAIIFLGYTFYSIGCWWYHKGRNRAIAGIGEPIQQEVTSESICFTKNGWDLDMKYLYSYDIEALVLHTKEYIESDNMGNTISPVDLLLAWGKVAEKNEELGITWEQGHRSGTWSGGNQAALDKYFDGDQMNIITNISNNHLIPAEENVKKDLLKVRRGDHIRLRGYLVSIDGVRKADGATSEWYSSTVRDDYKDEEGGQGCEVMYVTNVDWIDD